MQTFLHYRYEGRSRKSTLNIKPEEGKMDFHRLPIVLFGCLVLLFPQLAFANEINITKPVISKNPDLVKEVNKICRQSCKGNRRKGWIQSISYRKNNTDKYQINMEAKFRNFQHTGEIRVAGVKMGDGATVFDHTVSVKARGRLDRRTCVATLDDIWVENDFRGIFTKLLNRDNPEGKTTTLNGCADYLK